MNVSEKPLVSVIITTYHNEDYLPRAIDSVLRQSYHHIEVIVVDDNPPDSQERRATEQVMIHYPQVKYLKHSQNLNGAAARNTGIRAAEGEYIAFLDNDDFYFTQHIEKCVEALITHPECGCVLCGVVKIRGGLCWDALIPPKEDMRLALLFSEQALGTGSNLFIRSEFVRAVGGFDESFRRHQDVEFGLRLFEICRPIKISQIQIVKEMDGFSNAPDFKRFLEAKTHLWRKFENMLSGLSKDQQKRYYSGQYSALLYTACQSGNRKHINWAVSKLSSYRPLNKKEKLLVFLCRLHMFNIYERLKRIMKRYRSIGLYRQVIKNLSDGDRQVLDQALH